MNKQEFFEQLKKGLSGLPQNEIDERLTFYDEMIEDRIEEGLSEEEAVLAIGSVEKIIGQAILETPLAKIAGARIKPKRSLRIWEILLLVLGSPIWISLLIAVCVVVFAIYISIWSIVISLWAAFGSLIGGAFGGSVAGIGFILAGNSLSGVAMIGAGIVLAGLSIFMFFGCKASTKGILALTKKMAVWIKSCFIKKEAAA